MGKMVLLLYTDKYYLVNQVYPFGLDLIANYLRRCGHRVEIEYPFLPDMDWKRNLRQAIERSRPDVIGVGIRNLDTCMSCEKYGDLKEDDYSTFYFLPQVRELVSALKEVLPGVPIVAGGGAFTVSPVAILKYLGLDYGVVGEGEEPLRQFVEAFPDQEKISNIPNMVYPCQDGCRVNRREPYTLEASSIMEQREPKFNFAYQTNGVPVQAKRGCNRRCSYCVEPLLEGRKFVFRAIGSVIDELKAIADAIEEANTVFFVDTEFNLPDLTYCSDLLRAILREGLGERFRFVTQLIPKPLDLEFTQLLAEAGFSVVLSCESFSNAVLEKNHIGHKEQDITRAIETCDKSSMHCTVSLMFGLPGETYETMDHTLARMKEYPESTLRKYEYTVGGRIYLGTPLCDYVEKEGHSGNLYGTKSDGYLSPYYYCEPSSPFEMYEYIREVFPHLLCFDNKYEAVTHHGLGIGYLFDQGLRKDAVESFMKNPATIQAKIYEYLFKQLLRAERTDDAKAISMDFLDKINTEGTIGPGQADVVRFYLSCL